MKRGLALAGAGLAAAVAVVLLLLAVDVHRWQTRIAAGDVAFRTDPRSNDLWQPAQLVPFGAARNLLGLGDDLQAREALRIFKLGKLRLAFFLAGPQLAAYRSEAQALLEEMVGVDSDLSRRSQELNLVGVLELTNSGGNDPQQRQRHLLRAADDFRGAIALDPANDDAKFNLELALRLLQPRRQGGGAQSGLGGVTARGEQSGNGF